jgi:hypothetical protein
VDGAVVDDFLVESTLGDDPECSDGSDNDGDAQVDFPDDPNCSGASDDRERAVVRYCGLSFEILLVPAFVALRLRRRWKG